MADRRSVVVSEGLPASAPEPANDPRGAGGGDAPGRGVAFRANPKWTVPYRMAHALAHTLVRLWFRPQVRGHNVVPADGPIILAPVHRSFADFCFSVMLTDRKLFFMAKDEMWRSRLLGRFLVALGAFPVHRGGVDREAMGHATEVLEQGQLLIMFPEGTRQAGPRVQELLDGVAFLAGRTGAPIVPVGIGGSDVSMPKGAKVPKRTPITLVVGREVPPPAKRESGRVSRREVHKTTIELREALQEAYDEARA